MERLKVDWVTATERTTRSHLRLSSEVSLNCPMKWLQFKGYRSSCKHVYQGTFSQFKDVTEETEILSVYRISGRKADQLWEELCGTHITRLDLCVDTKRQGAFFEDLSAHREILGGKTGLITENKNGKKDGWTFTYGARISDVFLRIYDKSAESRLKQDGVTRVELELKGRTARAVWSQLSEHGFGSRLDHLFNGYVRRKVPLFPFEDYLEWFAGVRETEVLSVPVPVSEPVVRMQKYFKYLRRLCIEHPDEFSREFETFVSFVNGKVGGKGLW